VFEGPQLGRVAGRGDDVDARDAGEEDERRVDEIVQEPRFLGVHGPFLHAEQLELLAEDRVVHRRGRVGQK